MWGKIQLKNGPKKVNQKFINSIGKVKKKN